jgi:hypothetical protein
MNGHRRLKLGKLVLSFCAIGAFLIACNDRSRTSQKTFSKSAEQLRVASPNGQLDAVLIVDAYGGAVGGGVDSNVYIVRKGAPVYDRAGTEVFRADPMAGGKLVWKRDHLLEIHYKIAYIHSFRNVWGLYEVENVGSTGEHDYEVELQLVPESDSSTLNTDGSFRRLSGNE